jgi:hypothetical protein
MILFQTGFLGCFGSKVDAIEHYASEIERIENEVSPSILSASFSGL